MTFDQDKRNALEKADKSAKGSMDLHIKGLCDAINGKDDFFTTSSCAGRIVLISVPESGRKDESEWLFVSHGTAGPAELKESIKAVPDDDVWFRYEPFILHVACRTVAAANSLITLLRQLGIKRAGMISLGSKNVVEVIGTEHIEAIMSKGGRLLVDDDYIDALVESANRKLERNWAQIGRVTGELDEL